MTELVNFLNQNSGVISLLFAGVVAASTVVYAWLTARLVSETKRLREAETEPHIEVSYRPRDEWISLIDIVVKNIGGGPAYDLTFTWSANTTNKGSSDLIDSLGNIKGLSTGIAVLGPGQEFFSFWTSMTEHFEEKLQTQVTIRSRYRSASGQTKERQHAIDLSELKGVRRIGEPPLLKIAKNIEKLQGDLHKVATGFQKLKVDVFTSEDRERQRKEREEELEQLRSTQKPDDNAP